MNLYSYQCYHVVKLICSILFSEFRHKHIEFVMPDGFNSNSLCIRSFREIEISNQTNLNSTELWSDLLFYRTMPCLHLKTKTKITIAFGTRYQVSITRSPRSSITAVLIQYSLRQLFGSQIIIYTFFRCIL